MRGVTDIHTHTRHVVRRRVATVTIEVPPFEFELQARRLEGPYAFLCEHYRPGAKPWPAYEELKAKVARKLAEDEGQEVGEGWARTLFVSLGAVNEYSRWIARPHNGTVIHLRAGTDLPEFRKTLCGKQILGDWQSYFRRGSFAEAPLGRVTHYHPRACTRCKAKAASSPAAAAATETSHFAVFSESERELIESMIQRSFEQAIAEQQPLAEVESALRRILIDQIREFALARLAADSQQLWLSRVLPYEVDKILKKEYNAGFPADLEVIREVLTDELLERELVSRYHRGIMALADHSRIANPVAAKLIARQYPQVAPLIREAELDKHYPSMGLIRALQPEFPELFTAAEFPKLAG